ncbi:hypothetical protein FACS189499_00230 [Clostridia bacterium]|nr:hypothetical protein FACS189499_00230 [Clostridia bacterium]
MRNIKDREKTENLGVVEAVLFANGEPVSLSRIAEAAELSKIETAEILSLLERRYNVAGSGLQILRLEDSFQITTRPECAAAVKRSVESKRNAPLSPAALECLALIAYNQPVTKSFVSEIRGTDSGSVVNTLVERELAEECGRLDLPGRPAAYRTTENFLRCFGLSGLSELPPPPDSSGQMKLAVPGAGGVFTEEFAEEFAEDVSDADSESAEPDNYEQSEKITGQSDVSAPPESESAEPDNYEQSEEVPDEFSEELPDTDSESAEPESAEPAEETAKIE